MNFCSDKSTFQSTPSMLHSLSGVDTRANVYSTSPLNFRPINRPMQYISISDLGLWQVGCIMTHWTIAKCTPLGLLCGNLTPQPVSVTASGVRFSHWNVYIDRAESHRKEIRLRACYSLVAASCPIFITMRIVVTMRIFITMSCLVSLLHTKLCCQPHRKPGFTRLQLLFEKAIYIFGAYCSPTSTETETTHEA